MNQSNFWMFVHFSVISHSRLALLSSLAASDTSFGLQSLKYRPLTFSKSGSRAANKVVCAPLLVVLKSKYFKGTNKMLQRKESFEMQFRRIYGRNSPPEKGVGKLHMSHKLCFNDSGMKGIDGHSSSLQALGQFASKEHVGQFALTVGVTIVVSLFTIQIVEINFAGCMHQAGYINDTTWCSFLRRRNPN